MSKLLPIAAAEVAKVLRDAKIRASVEMVSAMGRRWSTGWRAEQDDETCVTVYYHAVRKSHSMNRLDVCSDALKAAGYRSVGCVDSRRAWLDVFRRAEHDAAEHDPAACGPCDDHADATAQADRDETALDGAL